MKLLPYVPGLAAGVFLSRVLGEWVGLPNIWAAAGLTLASALSARGSRPGGRWRERGLRLSCSHTSSTPNHA